MSGKQEMTAMQLAALADLCQRYHVRFDAESYHPQFDLPPGYVAGWIGTPENGIFVGVSPEGRISS